MSVEPARREPVAVVRAERLRIPAAETRLTDVRDHLQRFGADQDLPPRDLANLRLAVDDACSAIIRSLGARGAGAEIEIVASTERAWTEVRIVLHGGTLPVDAKTNGPPAGLLMHRLMDEVEVERAPRPAWTLRQRIQHRRGPTLRARYSLRFALVLALLTVLACVPLWFLEGRRQAGAVEQSLLARAHGLADVARPVLRSKQEFAPEQTRLTEAVLGIREQEPRILTVHVVDDQRLVWASHHTASTFTHMPETTGLGPPDAHGVRRGMQRLEKEPMLRLCVPVDAGGTPPRVLGHVYFTVRWSDVAAAVRVARLRLVFGAVIVYGVATAVIAALFGAVVRPLQRLMDSLRNPETDELDVDGPDEIGAIAAAFNDVRARMLTAESNAEEHENLQQDLQLAREIQSTLLPQAPPRLEGYELGRWYVPAGEVGGDYYDFLDVNEHMTGVVVADVSGKGVPGSLVMGMLRTALRMEARGNTNAGDVLARMNAFLAGDMRKGMFVTMFYVILDSRSRVVSYASAGHNPMVLYRAATRETFFLKPRGFPVGLELPDNDAFGRSLDVERLRLHSGDVLVLYTDGVTDALDPSGKAYGEDRLLAAIQRLGHLPTDECVAALEADVRAFTGDAPPADDVTLVVIRDTSAPQAITGVRARLVEMVEKQGMSVEDACKELKVSPSTYYRFKPREAPAAASPTAQPAPASAVAAATADAPTPRSATAPLAVDTAGLAGTTTLADGVACLELRGVIDSVSSAALESLIERASATCNRLVVQLRAVTYISSRGWGVLAAGCATLRQRNGELVLSGMSDELAHVYRMLGFEQVLRTFADAAAARDALQRPASPAKNRNSQRGTEAKEERGKQKPSMAGAPPGAAKALAALAAAKGAAQGTAAAAVSMPLLEDLDDAVENWESLRVRRGVVGPGGEVTLLALEGVLDTVSARVFERVLGEAVSGGACRVLLDLSRTEFISSAGWGTFTAHLRRLRQSAGDLKLFGMSPELLRIYDVLGLGSVLERFDVLSNALEAFGLAVAADPAAEVPAETHACGACRCACPRSSTAATRRCAAPAGTRTSSGSVFRPGTKGACREADCDRLRQGRYRQDDDGGGPGARDVALRTARAAGGL
jgi:anti-anti-sigma factor